MMENELPELINKEEEAGKPITLPMQEGGGDLGFMIVKGPAGTQPAGERGGFRV